MATAYADWAEEMFLVEDDISFNIPKGLCPETPPQHLLEPSASIPPAHVRIAYFMMTHDAPDDTMRLIQAVDNGKHLFAIHVDARRDDTFAAIEGILLVTFLKPRS